MVATHTKALRDVLELLLERELVEALAERELPVHTLLGDVEVLHVEEAILAHGLQECLRQLLLALRGSEQAEVEGDEVRPVEVLLRTFRSVLFLIDSNARRRLTLVSGTKLKEPSSGAGTGMLDDDSL